MDLEIFMLSEVSRTEKDKYHDDTYMWNLKYDTNELIYKARRHRKRVVSMGKGHGEGNDWEFWISRCKLLYIEWIKNKVLLYSTGNYIHYPVINHIGKEYGKKNIYV